MSRRKTISVHDYPEHLNPFSEIHQHQPQYEPEPFKFHTMGRPKRRASISNAWNMFASRKTKPVEASLNLSPRLPRTSSLANNELQEPPPPARRKLFSDFSWLPGRRRFGSVSQQSSPSTPRRNKTPYPEETTAQRYRSISLTRTSETTVYRPGETPLITPRTHRYRSPSLIPSDHDPYRTISGYPAVNGGDYRYPHERRNRSSSERLNVEEIPRRTRSSSLSPTANGGPYSTRLYIDEPPSRTSTQGLERLYIEEPADRQRSSVTVHRRLYGEESPKKTPNGDQHDVQDSPRNRPSSVSPTSSGGRQSPAVTPSHERSSPFDEPLVSQRPPRPPRTKKRRAPLPPLPQFAQKTEPAPSNAESGTTESPQQPTVSAEKSISSENLTNDSEEQLKVTDSTAKLTEHEVEAIEPNAVDKLTVISDQQLNIAGQQMSTSEQQLQIVEQQTNTSEQQMNVAELQTNMSELHLNVTEAQSEQGSVKDEIMEMPRNSDCETETAEVDKTLLNKSEKEDSDSNAADTPVCKPETKIRTKFGVLDTP
ncbi:serine/arginine repetitive matrix protein 2 isoform X1 [Anabrus simplex]|uniref:serine/arginine repetitive matrix protein 2 isoform X1 n=1 Tax=Anabrus simplex TaxID=316456 RepID=UPI0035A2BCBB